MDESRVGLTSLTGGGLHQRLKFLAASHVAYLIFPIYTLGLIRLRGIKLRLGISSDFFSSACRAVLR